MFSLGNKVHLNLDLYNNQTASDVCQAENLTQ